MAPADDVRDLRLAFSGRQLQVHYQPLVDVPTGVLLGAEALVRWNHPNRGVIAPSEFLPVAEEDGLIVDIGYLVFEDACSLLARWQDAGLDTLSVSVNVSLRQFTETHLRANLAEILQTHGVAPRRLVVEVSDALLDRGSDSLDVALADLRGLGVRLALDDFGAGPSRYAPHNALRHLLVDIVKIDRSVIAELEWDEYERELALVALDYTHSRGLVTVAEGVERTGQLERLNDMGCDQAQGYLLGRPQPAASVTALASD